MKSAAKLSDFDSRLKSEAEPPGEVLHPDLQENLKELADEYRFPGPCDWVLKVVQAAVQSGAKELCIDQNPTQLHFEFKPEGWDDIDLQDCLFVKKESDARGFQTLQRALWDASLKHLHPFQIKLPNRKDGVLWKGQEFELVELEAREVLCLTVSLRTVFVMRETAVLDEVVSGVWSLDLGKFLKERAFAVPLKLLVNGIRCDGFGRADEERSTESTLSPKERGPLPHDTWSFFVETGGTNFSGGTLKTDSWAFRGYPSCSELSEKFQILRHKSDFSGLGILTSDISADGSKLKAHPAKSFIKWIKDGVVIQEEALSFDPRSCYLILYLCADEVSEESEHFALEEDGLKGLRLKALVDSATKLVKAEPNFKTGRFFLNTAIQATGYTLLIIGAALATLALAKGVGLFVLGAVIAFLSYRGRGGLSKTLRSEFRHLCEDWHSRFSS